MAQESESSGRGFYDCYPVPNQERLLRQIGIPLLRIPLEQHHTHVPNRLGCVCPFTDEECDGCNGGSDEVRRRKIVSS